MDNNIEKKQPAMPECDELILSSSPHIQTPENISGIMLKVLIALIPVMASSIYFFGSDALKMLLYCAAFCIGAEALWCFLAKKPIWETISDGSALLTGVILALNLSAKAPWFIALIGAFLAIWLGKQVFGGLGCNPFNPALVARVGLLIALPGLMTSWTPTSKMMQENQSEYTQIFYNPQVDAVSCATPLGIVSALPKDPELCSNSGAIFKPVDNPKAYLHYFLGNRAGSMGETSALALLIGGALLLFWKLINWRIPVFFIGTVIIFTGIINFFYPGLTPSPLFHILTGGLLFGAIFMATDIVTSPITDTGAIFFGIGCGLVSCIIRIWGINPEGVSFAILFMNGLVPLLDRAFTRRPFGFIKSQGGAK